MPSLALTFDPRYVTAALDVWRAHDASPMTMTDLEREITRLMRQRATAWTEMGLSEHKVTAVAVTRAIGVFISLKLAKRTTKGRGEARVVILSPSADGREVLLAPPVADVLYSQCAERLSGAPSVLRDLLDLLAKHGPLTMPVLHPTLGAPKRGATYKAYVDVGLREYRNQAIASGIPPTVGYELASPKATPAQRLKYAQGWAAQAHPAGMLRQLDKAVDIGLAFGLLWVDVSQVNEVIGARAIGLAATATATGYRPNSLMWPDDSDRFLRALVNAVSTRANGSGFATIQEVRGAVGRKLTLSPLAVDSLLRDARDAGDRHDIPLELHFEPDESVISTKGRNPLVWRANAFEFVTVVRGSH